MADNTLFGHYRLALIHGADSEAFAQHMRDTVFADPKVMRPTRITRGFGHRLLREADGTHFLWEVTADLTTDKGYDFAANADLVQTAVQDYAVLTGVESYDDLSGHAPRA